VLEKDGASSFFEKSDSMLGKGPDSLFASVNRMLKKAKFRACDETRETRLPVV
jgi:hypothetical protein